MPKLHIQTYLNDVEQRALNQIRELDPTLGTLSKAELFRYIIMDYANKLKEEKRLKAQSKELSIILNTVVSTADALNVEQKTTEESIYYRKAEAYIKQRMNQKGEVRYAPLTEEQQQILEKNQRKKEENTTLDDYFKI